MNICFFDFETTGLDVKNANILEAAFVDFLSGKTINHSYILPYDVETIENSNIHNITFESLKLNNAITFENFIENIFNLLKDFYNNKNTIYLIAHNNFNYDQLVLEYNMKKINKNIEDIFKFCDSLLMIKLFRPDLKQYNLKYLSSCYLINFNKYQFHTALDDTNALLNIVLSLINNNKSLINHFYDYIVNNSRFSIRNYSFKNLSLDKIPNLYNINNLNNIEDLFNLYKKLNNEEFTIFLKEKYYFKRMDKINKITEHFQLIINE